MGLAGYQGRQDLTTKLLDHGTRAAPAVFEIQDDIVDARCAYGFEKAQDIGATAAEAEVDRLRRLVGRLGQIDIEGLREGLEDARRRRLRGRAPLADQLRTSLAR